MKKTANAIKKNDEMKYFSVLFDFYGVGRVTSNSSSIGVKILEISGNGKVMSLTDVYSNIKQFLNWKF